MKSCRFCKIDYPEHYYYGRNLKCKHCYQAIRVAKHPNDYSAEKVASSHSYLALARSDYKLLLGLMEDLSKTLIFRRSDEELLQMGEEAIRKEALPLHTNLKYSKELKELQERVFNLFY